MKKTILAFLLACLACLPGQSRTIWHNGVCYETISDTEVAVAQHLFTKLSGDVVIPPTIDDYGTVYRVTAIYHYAFSNNANLTSIKLPGEIRNIGIDTFKGCVSLKRIVMPAQLTTVDAGAFSGCKSLEKITFPPAVTSIHPDALEGCKALTQITVYPTTPPDFPTGQNNFFFSRCKLVTPYGTTDAYKKAWPRFKSYGQFDEKLVADNLVKCEITALDALAVADNSRNFEEVIDLPAEVEFNGLSFAVTHVNHDAFAGNAYLTQITLPSSVATIGERTFAHCRQLMSVELSSTFTTLAESTFEECSSLKAIALPALCAHGQQGGLYGPVALVFRLHRVLARSHSLAPSRRPADCRPWRNPCARGHSCYRGESLCSQWHACGHYSCPHHARNSSAWSRPLHCQDCHRRA